MLNRITGEREYNNGKSKFDVLTPGRLQVPHDASIRGSFDTLQIIDDIRVPNGKWG